MKNVFAVYLNSKTYSNIFYHIIAFPLGLIYFIFLTTLISLGFGLLITIIGIPILVAAIYLWRFFARMEIALVEHQFGIKFPPKEHHKITGFVANIKFLINDSFTWKALAFCYLKFPFGLFSFTIVITLLSISFGFLTAPFFYNTLDIDFYYWQIDTLLESIIISILGMIILTFTLYFCNWLAILFSKLVQLFFYRQPVRQEVSNQNT